MAVAEFFKPQSNHIFVATGLNFADAVSGAVLAAQYNSSIMLVGNQASEDVKNYIETYSIKQMTVFGGVSAVSSTTEEQLRSLIQQ